MAKNNRRLRELPFGPIVLIVLGVVFLLNNLALLQQGFLETVLGLWPLLLVFWGINSWIRSKRVFGPVLLIGAGSTFTLANLGLLQVNPWLTILRLWPLLIIAIGLDVLMGKRTNTTAFFGVILGLGLLAVGIWYSETQITRMSEENVQVLQPMGDFRAAQVVLQPSIASVTVFPLVDSRSLIEGTYQSPESEPYTETFKESGGTATYTLQSSVQEAAFGVWDEYRFFWNIGLNTGLPIDLDLDLGVGEATLDLADLQLADFDLSSGVSQVDIALPGGDYSVKIDGGVGRTTLVLPEGGDLRIDLDMGVGQIAIQVPENLAIQVHANRGLAGIRVPGGFSRSGNVYSSPDFSTAEDRAVLYLDVGVGSVSVEVLPEETR